jgi:REP element-mobilizing transposase RayT
MTYARSQLVDESTPGFYHCMSRCVRRSFLCGEDHYTGQNFDHRKQWIEDRIFLLTECFSVSLYAYAVMSNHLHVVLRVDPVTASEWGDEEVIRRWVKAFPGTRSGEDLERWSEARVVVLLANPDKVKEIRNRLGSLSWFMRALNEPIARMANREDHCSGRFWEGRFKSQALLDEQAVLSCMAYVDLNPVRAKICDQLEGSEHTSLTQRIETARRGEQAASKPERITPLRPVAGLQAELTLTVSEADYLAIVRWTGQQARPDKRGKLKPEEQSPPPSLNRIDPLAKRWLNQVQGTESVFYRAIGSAEALKAKAEAIGQRWLKGLRSARAERIPEV